MSDVMNTVEKEIIRKDILKMCMMADGIGACVEVLTSVLKKGGHAVNAEEVIRQLHYLEGKNLITLQHVGNQRLKLERLIASITPEGIDYMEGNTPSIPGVSDYDE